MAPTPISSCGGARAEENGDQRDERLRHRRADGRQYAADGAFVQAQVKADPLDGVDEQLGGDKDGGKAEKEKDKRYRHSLPRRATG